MTVLASDKHGLYFLKEGLVGRPYAGQAEGLNSGDSVKVNAAEEGFTVRYRGREETWAEKLAHDLEYIADRSVGLYLRVVLATAWRVIRQSAAAVWGLLRGGRH